jgi:ABC-type glutathione transport system ATPase component
MLWLTVRTTGTHEDKRSIEMPYTTRDIRNIALVGQAGAGKTLLAEALLAQSGAIRSKGSLARGTTVCDFDPRRKRCCTRSMRRSAGLKRRASAST